MVWGLEEPGGFGIYYPDHDYPGWEERLEAYWQNEMTEEEKKRIEARVPSNYRFYVSQKFESEVGSLIHKNGPIALTPLLPHELPGEFRTKKTMPELGALMWGYGLIVSEPLKEIIERLEPCVHLFWSLRVTGPKGVEYPGRYYGMQIRRFLGSFQPDLSAPGSWSKAENVNRPIYRVNGPRKSSCAELAMSERVISGAHIWYERYLKRPKLFISDTLQDEIKKAGLKVWQHYKMKSV